jgi:hypothetical protein
MPKMWPTVGFPMEVVFVISIELQMIFYFPFW